MSKPVCLEIINPLSYPGWDDLVIASGRGSFFHSSFWARVLHESYGYNPAYFVSFNGTGIETLVPCMEISSRITGKRGVSLPFTDYCEPIIPDGCEVRDVIEHIIRFGKDSGWQYLELRSGIGLPGLKPSAVYYGHVLDISRDDETQFSAFRRNVRKNIRNAQRQGVKISMSCSLESVKEFYRLNCMTRKAHGLPPQPFRFFEEVHRHILSRGHGIIVLAGYDGTTIACAMFLHFGDTAMDKYGVSDKRYQHVRANNLIIWEAIRYYRENGIKNLCLGRTELDNDGLLDFKRGWGGQERAVNYYKYDLKRDVCVEDQSRLHGFHNKVFANLPIPVLRFAGALLYRHIG